MRIKDKIKTILSPTPLEAKEVFDITSMIVQNIPKKYIMEAFQISGATYNKVLRGKYADLS